MEVARSLVLTDGEDEAESDIEMDRQPLNAAIVMANNSQRTVDMDDKAVK